MKLRLIHADGRGETEYEFASVGRAVLTNSAGHMVGISERCCDEVKGEDPKPEPDQAIIRGGPFGWTPIPTAIAPQPDAPEPKKETWRDRAPLL